MNAQKTGAGKVLRRTAVWMMVLVLMLMAIPQSAQAAFKIHIPSLSTSRAASFTPFADAASGEPSYTENWDEKRGKGSVKCEYMGEGERTEDGWIHWVFSTKGASTSASLTLGGTGSGTYEPGEPLTANVWHFYTPYFDVNGLTATISLYGGSKGKGGGLVISDLCAGTTVSETESLKITKTADTSYTRTHDWSIAKSVNPEVLNLPINGFGDVEWTVEVEYLGSTESNHKISGQIVIENTSTGNPPPAVGIASVVDTIMLGNDDEGYDPNAVIIDCEWDFESGPYTLAPGESLTCTYEYETEGRVEGHNEVEIVTASENTYELYPYVSWDWDEADVTEADATVTVVDSNKGDLGTVNAADVEVWEKTPFTYPQSFAWADYGQAGCGNGKEYVNTASIYGDDYGDEDAVALDSATATLIINVQCYIYETAFAKNGEAAICFIPTFSRWGWTNPITQSDESYTMDLWAAAGQCDTGKGTLVGTVTVVYGADGKVAVTYNVDSPYSLDETHVYAGTTKYQQVKQGKGMVDTVAPGQYKNAGPFGGGQVYVIAHAVVGIPDPNFP